MGFHPAHLRPHLPPARVPAAPTSAAASPASGTRPTTSKIPAPSKVETIHTFGWYLRKYITDVKAKGATPILCSLVPRKIWVDGKIHRSTDTYRGWTQQVAAAEHVGFVDLNEIIARRYDALGPDAVDKLFGDPHTHTDLAGAQLNAECVVSGLRALPHHPLDPYLSPKGRAIQPYTA